MIIRAVVVMVATITVGMVPIADITMIPTAATTPPTLVMVVAIAAAIVAAIAMAVEMETAVPITVVLVVVVVALATMILGVEIVAMEQVFCWASCWWWL